MYKSGRRCPESALALAEELDSWIPRNHRTRDHQHDDYSHEFHVTLSTLACQRRFQNQAARAQLTSSR